MPPELVRLVLDKKDKKVLFILKVDSESNGGLPKLRSKDMEYGSATVMNTDCLKEEQSQGPSIY